MATSKNRYNDLKPYVMSCVRNAAQRIARHISMNDVDLEDLEQELMTDLLRRLPEFDPKKAQFNTFCSKVVNNQVKTLLNGYTKKNQFHTCSLQETLKLESGQTVERVETINVENWQRLFAKLDLPESKRCELSMDIERYLKDLPDHLKKLCEQLITKNVSEVSRETGVPRATIYGRIKDIKNAINSNKDKKMKTDSDTF